MIRLLLILFVVLWPLVHVLVSQRVHGNQKYAWATVVLLTSWIGYLVFLIKIGDADR